jgi:hypothetical protein
MPRFTDEINCLLNDFLTLCPSCNGESGLAAAKLRQSVAKGVMSRA